MIVKCPICAKTVTRSDAEFPFCSDRCRTVDLGNWASGKYVIPASNSREIPLPEPHDEE